MEVYLPWLPNVEFDGYCGEMKEIFECLGCFWRGCPCTRNKSKPIGKTIELLLSRCEETQASLKKNRRRWLWCYLELGGASLKNPCAKIHISKINFALTPYVKNCPINIRVPPTAVEPKTLKNVTQSTGDEIHYVVISLFPYICTMFPVSYPKLYVGADCPWLFG